MRSIVTDVWFTRQEAAARLGVGLRTLDGWRAQEAVAGRSSGPRPAFVAVKADGRVRHRILYSERELERYVRQQAHRDINARARLISAIRLHTQRRLLAEERGIRLRLRELARAA
jgi:hypothetical protein